MMDEGRDLVVLDSRPIDEFRNMSIPTAVDCPGAELVYRARDYAPDPNTLVVVNCAGRTRSIIGAQSLINAGLPNKVVALKNGTMGWHLAGLQVDHGKDSTFKPRSAEAAAWAREAATKVAQKVGVSSIDKAGLAALEAKGGSLFRFDVRDPAEYAAGHLKGFLNAPGGQLVQATDRYVGVRNATIVLHDDDGVRATMTAHWLLQMGWTKVYVLKHAASAAESETGATPTPVLGLPTSGADEIGAADVKALLDAGKAVVVDLATSLQYRDKGHIPGAWFAIRAHLARRIPELLAKAGPGASVVLTSPDGVLSALAAPEVAALGLGPVKVLKGGTPAWGAAGFALEKGATRMADPLNDVWYRPYDRTEGVEAAMNEYLVWEVDLISPTNRDGDAKFRVLRS
jgi:rhodanese-related sulfurtransferase